jgi:hypothetical protein
MKSRFSHGQPISLDERLPHIRNVRKRPAFLAGVDAARIGKAGPILPHRAKVRMAALASAYKAGRHCAAGSIMR